MATTKGRSGSDGVARVLEVSKRPNGELYVAIQQPNGKPFADVIVSVPDLLETIADAMREAPINAKWATGHEAEMDREDIDYSVQPPTGKRSD